MKTSARIDYILVFIALALLAFTAWAYAQNPNPSPTATAVGPDCGEVAPTVTDSNPTSSPTVAPSAKLLTAPPAVKTPIKKRDYVSRQETEDYIKSQGWHGGDGLAQRWENRYQLPESVQRHDKMTGLPLGLPPAEAYNHPTTKNGHHAGAGHKGAYREIKSWNPASCSHVDAKVQQEAERRMSADAALYEITQLGLGEEAKERILSDAALTEGYETEKADRELAISKEKASREEAIAKEADARRLADAELAKATEKKVAQTTPSPWSEKLGKFLAVVFELVGKVLVWIIGILTAFAAILLLLAGILLAIGIPIAGLAQGIRNFFQHHNPANPQNPPPQNPPANLQPPGAPQAPQNLPAVNQPQVGPPLVLPGRIVNDRIFGN